MPLLFSYGTLQEPSVQLETFGRRLHGWPDEILGFDLGTCRVADLEFVAKSGKADHAIVRFTGKSDSRVTVYSSRSPTRNWRSRTLMSRVVTLG